MGAGQWYWIRGAEAPKRDETILVGFTKNGEITAELSSNGGSWSLISDITGSSIIASGFTQLSWPSCGVAYESIAGNALLVWNGKDEINRLRYSVWNGYSWTISQGVPGYTGSEPQWIVVRSSPIENEIIVAIGDGDDNVATGASTVDYVVVWDGSTWGDVLELDNSGSDYTEQSVITVQYMSQSGKAMVIYSKNGASGDTSIYYRVWGGSWGSERTLTAPGTISGSPQWTDLQPDRSTNRLVLGVHTNTNMVWLCVWDGTSWEAPQDTATNTGSSEGSNVAVAFESESGTSEKIHFRLFGAVL